jgi:hypothetical protein
MVRVSKTANCRFNKQPKRSRGKPFVIYFTRPPSVIGDFLGERGRPRPPPSASRRRHQSFCKKIPLAVRQRRLWTPAEDKLLGTVPDAEIAARLNRTIKAVEARRLTML